MRITIAVFTLASLYSASAAPFSDVNWASLNPSVPGASGLISDFTGTDGSSQSAAKVSADPFCGETPRNAPSRVRVRTGFAVTG